MSEIQLVVVFVSLLGIAAMLYPRIRGRQSPGEGKPTSVEDGSLLIKAQEEASKIRQAAQEELAHLRETLERTEERLTQKETRLDEKYEEIANREKALSTKIENVHSTQKEVEDIKDQAVADLQKVANLSRKDAEERLLKLIETELSQEIGKKVRQAEEEIKELSEQKAQEILIEAMRFGATDYVAEYTTSSIKLADPDMKGRIIGKEGRNIKAFEQITGVNVDLDETPGEIRLSCFDSVRREIARISLEKLLMDGRIQPARIEEVVQKTGQEIEQIMMKEGEKLCHAVNVYNIPKELVRLLGRFKYRYSYGQNMIQHTLEETQLGIKLAKELGADANTVRLACLFHDIGKVVDDNEGTHVDLGVDLLKKYQMPKAVIDCVAEHHEDKPFSTVESIIVYIADAISASRPGARHEDYEAYVKRMQDLETAALSFPGVKKVFAISAGREVRVVVEPEQVDDLSSFKLARDIANKIERELVYPGQVKVTVVREVRAEELAR